MKIRVIFISFFLIFACSQKKNDIKINNINASNIDVENLEKFRNFLPDSIVFIGITGGYKNDIILSDSIIVGFTYKLIGDTIFFEKDFNKDSNYREYIIASNEIKNLYNIFLETKPKYFEDYNPPLPISDYPLIHFSIYKEDSVYNEKKFLIVNDTLEYSNKFYKAVDFLYLLQIRNVQNENIEDFVKNYKW